MAMKFQTYVGERKFAANNEFQGVFELRGGAYSQHRGTGQTPTFKSAEQFRRYVQRMLKAA